MKEAQKELEEKYCNGLSADACSGALAAHRDELLAGGASFGADFVPVVGDIKSFRLGFLLYNQLNLRQGEGAEPAKSGMPHYRNRH